MRKFLPDDGFYSQMLRLAIPVSLQNMLASSLHLIDGAMVLRLGDAAAAGVGMVGRWFFLMNIIIFGVSSGSSILMSQYWGMMDMANIRRAYGMGLLNSMGMAVLLQLAMMTMPELLMRALAGDDPVVIELGMQFMSIACWGCVITAANVMITTVLRSTERVNLPLVSGVIMTGVNTLLNYLLIYGKAGFPALGVRGSAIATVIAQSGQLILLLAISYRQKNPAAARIRELLDISKSFVKKYYSVAIWVILNESLWSAGVLLYSVVFGRMGQSFYAAYSLYSSVEGVMFSLFIGLGSACVVIVGKSVGAGLPDVAWRDSVRFLRITTILAVVAGLALIGLRGQLIALVNPPNAETAAMAQRLLALYGCFMLVKLIPYIIIVGILRSGGSPKLGAIADLFCLYCIGIPAVFLMGFVLGPRLGLPKEVIFVSAYAEEVVKTIFCLVVFMRRKWMRRLTTEEDMQLELQDA